MFILILVLLIGAGFICLRYTMWVTKTFGHVRWVERYFGVGNSYAFWRLLGALLIVLAIVFLKYGHILVK